MAHQTPDDLKMRDWIYSLVDLSHAQAILDAGCGDGFDLRQIGLEVSDTASLVGIDVSTKDITAARTATEHDSRFSFMTCDLEQKLPFAEASFDVVFSTNVLECIPDKQGLLSELHRLLRPGGQVVLSHFDWDTQVINGANKQLIRQLVHTYADWQQPWMRACDPWMGRRLCSVLNASGLFEGKIHTYTLTNTQFSSDTYGYARIMDFKALARRGMVSAQDVESVLIEMRELADRGEYFYSINMYSYVGTKKV